MSRISSPESFCSRSGFEAVVQVARRALLRLRGPELLADFLRPEHAAGVADGIVQGVDDERNLLHELGSLRRAARKRCARRSSRNAWRWPNFFCDATMRRHEQPKRNCPGHPGRTGAGTRDLRRGAAHGFQGGEVQAAALPGSGGGGPKMSGRRSLAVTFPSSAVSIARQRSGGTVPRRLQFDTT